MKWSKGGAHALETAGAEVCNAATYGEVQEQADTVLLLIGWESFPVSY